MNNETLQILKAQTQKLPEKVRAYITTTDWDFAAKKIAEQFFNDQKDRAAFENEVLLILAGMVHPDGLRDILEREVTASKETIDAAASAADEKIIRPVYDDLVSFYDTERANNENWDKELMEGDEESTPPASKNTALASISPSEPTKPKPSLEEGLPPFGRKIPSVPVPPPRPPVIRPAPAPQIAVPLPPSPPQPVTPQAPVFPAPTAPIHPFEQQMKKVLTSTPVPPPQEIPTTPRYGAPEAPVAPTVPTPAPIPTTTTTPGHDPYREPVE